MHALHRRDSVLAGLLIVTLPSAVPADLLEQLPLERGFYVRSDERCQDATSAGTSLLRHAGLQWVTSHCVFELIEQIGPTTYRVLQSCGDPAYSERAIAIYEIPDRKSFSLTDDNGWEHAARLCAQADLPEPWRGADLSDLID